MLGSAHSAVLYHCETDGWTNRPNDRQSTDIQSSRAASYNTVKQVTLSFKVTLVAGFTMKNPEFDPLRVVDLL
jgi:hypothetical protein